LSKRVKRAVQSLVGSASVAAYPLGSGNEVISASFHDVGVASFFFDGVWLQPYFPLNHPRALCKITVIPIERMITYETIYRFCPYACPEGDHTVALLNIGGLK